MRPITAFLRLAGTAGVIERFVQFVDDSQNAASNARNSASAASGRQRRNRWRVTTSARAFAYRVATAESVIVIF